LPLNFNKDPTFGDNLRNQAFLDSEASKNPATTNRHSFAPQSMTLNVLILRWMKLLIFLFSLAFLFCVMFSSEGNFFGGYTMEMA
jgi:hypothetical protein